MKEPIADTPLTVLCVCLLTGAAARLKPKKPHPSSLPLVINRRQGIQERADSVLTTNRKGFALPASIPFSLPRAMR